MELKKHTDDIITPEIGEQIRIRREKLTATKGELETALESPGVDPLRRRKLQAELKRTTEDLAAANEDDVRRRLEWDRENGPRIAREEAAEHLAGKLESLTDRFRTPAELTERRLDEALVDFAEDVSEHPFPSSLADPALPEGARADRETLDELHRCRRAQVARRAKRLKQATPADLRDLLYGDDPERFDRAAKLVVVELAAHGA
jgi:hypothetical protein